MLTTRSSARRAPLAALLAALFVAGLFVDAARAQRAIEPGTSPWTARGVDGPVQLGELRLPDVRDLAPVDLARFRGAPLLLVEFASW